MRGQGDRLDNGAFGPQGILGFGNRRPDFRVGVLVLVQPVGDIADLHAFHATVQLGGVIGYRHVRRSRVERVEPGHLIQRDGRILDAPAQRAAMIHGEGQREDTAPADPAIGRLHADGAAIGRRATDRAAGVGAERHPGHAGSDGRAGAGGGAAGHVVGVPGVAGRRKQGFLAGAAGGEFDGRAFAEQHGAAIQDLLHRMGIAVRDHVRAQFRLAGGQDASRVVDILGAERNAVQRAEILPGHQFLLCPGGALQGDFRDDRIERAQAFIMRGYGCQRVPGCFDGRQRAIAIGLAEFGDGEIPDVRHRTSPPMTGSHG